MSDRLEIKITGTNQAHAAFQQVTTDAKSMGTAVEQAGHKSSQSLQQLNQRAAAFGAALGGATLLMGEFAKAAAEDEASQARLEQSVTNTGAAVDDYSASLEAAIKAGQQKAFSDDQTRDALVKLNLATNDTQKSIEELGLAMDLSRAKGISLSQAAEIIGKVYQGQYGALSRMGIVLDQNATKEQALAEVQKRVAGQAETYAETSAGWLDIQKDKIDELTESWGAQAGAMQSVLLMLPGLQAGYVALAGVVGGLGGLGGLARAGGALALPVAAGLSIAGLYNQYSTRNTPGGGWYENFLLQGMGIAGNIPGMGGVGAYSTEQLQRNEIESALAGAFYVPPGTEKPKDYLFNLITAQGYGYEPGVLGRTPSQTDISAWIAQHAAELGMTAGQWIASTFGRPDSGFVTDPTTGLLINRYEYTGYQQARTIAGGRPGQGNVYGTGAFGLASTAAVGGVSAEARAAAMRPHGAPMEFDPSAIMARAGGIPAGGGSGFLLDAAANAEAATAALKKQYGAYYDLISGMNGANGAAAAFKVTQDGLIDSQSVYGQQISEFSQQQNALTEGRDILLKRQEEGITLTKEEQDLLDNYPELYERVSGGVEDAKVQSALLSAQYIENMKQGDALNETMQGNTESTAALVGIIRELILGMEGIPSEVRSKLILEGYQEAYEKAVALQAALSLAAGTYVANFIVNQVGGNAPSGPQFQHGGVVGYANGGIPARLAEAGPELLSFANGGSAWAMHDGLYSVPRGTYVTPAPASRGRGGGNGLHFNGPVSITVVANDPRQMAAAIGEWAIGSSRS